MSPTASSADAPVAALYHPERNLYGVQFHPEVVHTERGGDLLERFLSDVCQCLPSWTHTSIIESQVDAVRAAVGSSPVLCALSGGVDSAVAAALVHKAVGDQLTCVYVDTGLMRADESAQVEETFRRQFKIDLIHVKAADRFFEALAGVTDPEGKRKIIGELFIRIFEEVARDLVVSQFGSDAADGATGSGFLVQGTLYPDVIESGSGICCDHQVAPQRRWASRGPGLRPGRAASPAVQGRSAGGGRGARPAARHRVAPAVPRPRARGSGGRRGDPRAGRDPACSRCDRRRGDPAGRALP